MATLTTNKNFLMPSGFKLTIDSTLYPNLEFFCTNVTLPEIGIESTSAPFRGDTAFVTGDRVSYGDLAVTVLVDEDMNSYKEVYDWIVAQAKTDETLLSDGALSILSSKNRLNNTIRFNDMFPTSLGGVEFVTSGEAEYLSVEIAFKYTTFTFG